MHLFRRYSTGALFIVSLAVSLLSTLFIIDCRNGSAGTIAQDDNVLVPQEAPFPLACSGISLKNPGYIHFDGLILLQSLQVFTADKPGKAIFPEDDSAASAEPSLVSISQVAQLSAMNPYSGALSEDTLFFSSSGLSPPV